MKIKQTRFPCKALVFSYGDKGRVTWNMRVMLRARAKKANKELYYKPIDCGDFTGVMRGKIVAIDRLGRFVFGLQGFKASTLVVPYYTHLEVLMYTDNPDADMLVIDGALSLGMKLTGVKKLTCGEQA